MIGYILFAFVVVAANATYDARLTSYDLNAWKQQQAKLKAQNGLITGEFKKVPPGTYSADWNNEIFTVPRGATNVTVINYDTNTVQMLAGVKGSHSGDLPYHWAKVTGDVNQHYNYDGVNFHYFRSGSQSHITIQGPVNPKKDDSTQYNFFITAAKGEQGSYGLANIKFSYTAHKEGASSVVGTKYDAQLQSYDLNAWKQQQTKLKAQDGLIKGEYKMVPPGSYNTHFRNEIATLPRGATNVKIMNYDINTVQLLVGVKGSHSGSVPYHWTRVNGDLNKHYTLYGVTIHYYRSGTQSHVTIEGPVNPIKDGSAKFNLFVITGKGKKGSYGLANIEFTYTAHKTDASG